MNNISDTARATEQEVITINQGRAKSSHFPIIKPSPGGVALTPGQPVRCIHPRTGQIATGIVTKHFWSIDWAVPPEGFLLLTFGCESKQLRAGLIKADPGFKEDWAVVVLIMETI